MNFNEFLDHVTAIQGVHDEESLKENFDALYSIATPKANPVEMGEAFKTAIGYNPITYYDEKYIDRLIGELISGCSDYPQSVRRLQTMQSAAKKVAMNAGMKAKENEYANTIWNFAKDQLEDVGEMNMSQIFKLGESFMSAHNIGGNRQKNGDRNRQDRDQQKRPRTDFDDLGSDMDDIDIGSDFIVDDDDDYDF